MTHVGFHAKPKFKKGFNTFSSLRNRDYRYLWIGILFDMGGQWIQQVTLGWLVWELSGSAMMVGITAGLRRDNPVEYERIADLRDGIRTARPSANKGLYVFCQAGRYQQLFFLNEKGEILSRDIPRILGVIKCGPEIKALGLSSGYNAAVMRVKRQFAETVKQRQAELEHTLSLSQGQRYVLRELRALFIHASDDDTKIQINILEKTFRGPLTTAINREINRIRRNGMTGENLMRALTELYHQHSMRDWSNRRDRRYEDPAIPKLICSEGLL